MSERREFRQSRFRRPPGACDILLVRHGESAPYEEGVLHPLLDGHGNPPLDPVGHEQAQRVADRFTTAGEPVDAIYVTTLQRTHQTAAPLVERTGLTPVVEPDLREVYLGEWEGGEFRKRMAEGDPIALEVIRRGRWDVIPSAEPGEAFAARVRGGIERIAATHPDQVVVAVVHGGVIGQAMALASGGGPFAFSGADNASISHLVVLGSAWAVRCFNDTSHLTPTFVTAGHV